MTAMLDVAPAHQALLLDLLQRHLPGVPTWAFGSRVTGKARATSDLDLVVFAPPERKAQVFVLREALEESALPFEVDLLVWDDIPTNFRHNIQRAYIELI